MILKQPAGCFFFVWIAWPRLVSGARWLVVDIAAITSPAFIISGTDDVQTPAFETRRIFAAAQGDKRLWLVQVAKHVNLHDYAALEYERRVGTFLETHLRSGAASKKDAAR